MKQEGGTVTSHLLVSILWGKESASEYWVSSTEVSQSSQAWIPRQCPCECVLGPGYSHTQMLAAVNKPVEFDS